MGRRLKWLFVDRYGCRGWVYVASVVLVLGGLIGGITALLRRTDIVRCRNTATAMHREYRSGWLEGCLVKLDDGTFIPLGNLRTTDLERAK